MNATTQAKTIVDYCKAHGSITQRQAFKLGIYRLASRIHDLRVAGYLIDAERVKVKNKDGSHSYIAKYTILRGAGNE